VDLLAFLHGPKAVVPPVAHLPLTCRGARMGRERSRNPDGRRQTTTDVIAGRHDFAANLQVTTVSRPVGGVQPSRGWRPRPKGQKWLLTWTFVCPAETANDRLRPRCRGLAAAWTLTAVSGKGVLA
jgi:hypothetical protein